MKGIRDPRHPEAMRKYRVLHSYAISFYDTCTDVDPTRIRRNALNRMFELAERIRPDYNDLLDEETKNELLALEMELRKWHKE